MTKRKKILICILIVILSAGYLALASYLIGFYPTGGGSKDIIYGNFVARTANNDIGKDDNTVFQNIEKNFLFNENDEIANLKLMNLYFIDYKDGEAEAPQNISLPIEAKYASDSSLKVIRIVDENELTFIKAIVDKRMDINNKGKEQEVTELTFEVEEPGYYAIAVNRKTANYSWLIFISAIVVLLAVYFLLFIRINKKKRKKYNQP